MGQVQLRHGLFMAPYHGLDENPTTLFQQDLELLELADRLGYAEAWVGEHHSCGSETIGSPELFIAHASAKTSRIVFGTGVISLPYHHPFMVAERIVQLDHITRGRVKFGVGPGILVQDARMLGIDPAVSRDRMVESLQIILRLLRGERVTQKSEWYELVDAELQILPYTQPYPEIAVASSLTPMGAQLAGTYDLGLLCFSTDHSSYGVLEKNWRIANEVATRHNRTMDPGRLRLVGPMHIAETREKARENVRFGFQKFLDYIDSVVKGRFKIPAGADPVAWFVDNGYGVIGTPADAIAVIEKLQVKVGEFGVFCQQCVDWADWAETRRSYELYMRFVVPHFDRSNAARSRSLETVAAKSVQFEALRQAAAAGTIAKLNAERDGAVR